MGEKGPTKLFLRLSKQGHIFILIIVEIIKVDKKRNTINLQVNSFYILIFYIKSRFANVDMSSWNFSKIFFQIVYQLNK